MSRIRVASIDEIGEERPTMYVAEADGREVLLVLMADGEIHAIDAVCTHGFGYLDQGELKGCEVECPLHEGRFDVRTGKPTNPPADEPLGSYPAEIVDGEVFVEW